MRVIVLFELRRGKPKPSQWHQDTQENYALWWLGFGLCPSRSSWYEFRDRTGPCLDPFNASLLHRVVAHELTTAQRGALDGSAIAANASRRRLLDGERLQQRLQQLEAVAEDEAQGEEIEALPGWMGKTPPSRRQQNRYLQAQDELTEFQAANAQRPPAQCRAPAKVVVSPGDPEAPLGLDKDHVYRPLYTVYSKRGHHLADPCQGINVPHSPRF